MSSHKGTMWMEIIRVRSEESLERAGIFDELAGCVHQPGEQDLQECRVCSSALGRDVMIQFTWSGGLRAEGSRLGRLTAADMGRFGLVDYSIWEIRE